jgi:two-component system C4-dicarboxylate transport sensor histidine kinase DctB
MGSIIGQLKSFSRKSRDPVSAVDLSAAIAASVMLLDNEFRQRQVAIDIDIEAGAAGATVIGDSVHTEQVLINLLRNALDATEAVADPARRRVLVRLGWTPGGAIVCIRDHGAGIAEDVAPHLFEPFFTTKSSSKGLGLGLAISSSIIQAMNGQLEARNHPDGGAEFIVRLPLQQDDRSEHVQHKSPGRGRTA